MMEAKRADIEVMMARFPGFKFAPTDMELLDYYLKKKIEGQNDESTDLIVTELDIVKFDPWDLPEKALIESEKVWFYFNSGVRKFAGYTRNTEHGYWMQIGTERLIRPNLISDPIGVKRTLVFFTGHPPNGVKTLWLMHELSMIDQPKESMSVCRLVKKRDSKLKHEDPIFTPYWESYPNSTEDDAIPMISNKEMFGGLPPYSMKLENTEGFAAHIVYYENCYDQTQTFNRPIENETSFGSVEWLNLPASYPMVFDNTEDINNKVILKEIRREKRRKRNEKSLILLMKTFKEMEKKKKEKKKEEIKRNPNQEEGE